MSKTASSPGRRAVKRTLLVVAMLFVIYYLVLPQLVKGREAADLLARVNPFLLVVAVLLEIASLLAYTILTRVTLPTEPHLSLFTIFRIQLATKSVTNLVPGGSAAGGTLGYRLFTEAGVAPTAAGFAMATVGLGSAVVLNLILWVSLLISIPFNGFNPIYVTAAIVGVLLLASAAALVYLLMKGQDRAELILRAIARRTPFVKEETAARFIHQLADRLHDLAGQPELIRDGAIWATINWLLDAAALWVFLRAFGESLNPINLIVAYGVAGVLAAIPITPGRTGCGRSRPALVAGRLRHAGRHRRHRCAGLAPGPVLDADPPRWLVLRLAEVRHPGPPASARTRAPTGPASGRSSDPTRLGTTRPGSTDWWPLTPRHWFQKKARTGTRRRRVAWMGPGSGRPISPAPVTQTGPSSGGAWSRTWPDRLGGGGDRHRRGPGRLRPAPR